MHDAIRHHEQARVWFGSMIALSVSYTSLMEGLRATLLVLSIVYTLLKIWKSVRPKAPINDTDPPIKP